MTYPKIAIICEGQTEEQFVTHVLLNYLQTRAGQKSFHVQPIIVKTSRPASSSAHKGGGNWQKWQKQIENVLSADYSLVTTLFDFYGLPNDFPGSRNSADDSESAMRQAVRKTNTDRFCRSLFSTSLRR